MENKFKFSVIIPVYNVEKYLAETLDSVINQTIGFEENIQLIIVNDGSPDNSADICKKYKDMYPDNIVYIEKENGGVSSARNEGIKYVEGKYINFLDSDDKWELNAFETAYDFFEKHYDELDIVSCRIKLFEAKSGFQALDYRFKKGTRVADINNSDEYYSLQVYITSVFIKSEAIKDFRFDTRMRYSEDLLFVNKLILEKRKIGLLKEALFYYRKRLDQSSAVDKLKYDRFYYIESFEYFHKALINYSKEKFGEVIPFVQAIISYDLLWRLDVCETHEVLNDDEFTVYKQKLKELLGYIDDDILFGQPNHKPYTRRSVAVNIKYDIDYLKSLMLKGNSLYFRKYKIFNMANGTIHCVLNSVSADNNRFRIEILVANWLLRSTADGGKLVLKADGRFVKPKETLEYAHKTVNTIDGGEYYYTSCVFNLKLKIKEGKTVKITPHIVYGEKKPAICINCSKFSNEANALKSCLVQGRYTIDYADNSIQVKRLV